MVTFDQFKHLTGLKQRDDEVGEHVLAMQYEHLKNHIPLLYLTVGFYFGMAIFVILTSNPTHSIEGYLAYYVVPMIVVPFAFVRAVIWYRRRNDSFERKKVEKIIVSLSFVSALISLICGVWAVLAWQADATMQRSYLALIMAMGSFSVAYCLAIVPFSATLCLIFAMLPISLLMLFTGDTFLSATALIVLTAMAYLVGLLRRHYVQMVQMIELQVQMHDLANTDTLTNLLNRRALIEEYGSLVHGESSALIKCIDQDDVTQNNAHRISSANVSSTSVSSTSVSSITMVMLDLDGFKPINDQYGHAAGDKMLQMIAERMKLHIGEYGHIARIGGDEFAIMFVNKPLQFCKQIIESLTYILSQHYIINDQKMTVGISHGLAHVADDIPSIEKLLSAADHHLYDMKAMKKQGTHGANTRRTLAS